MSITENHQKERYSLAYITAIIAKAGYNSSVPEKDYGADVSASEIGERNKPTSGKRLYQTGFSIDFQLKASKIWELQEGKIIYDLEVNNYNDLCNRSEEGATPLALALLCLPRKGNFHPHNDHGSLRIKKAMYWYAPFLSSQPTRNTSSVRIEIPTSQILTPIALQTLMKKYKEEGGICDAVPN